MAVILLGFALALFGVGRTTGSGWVMVIVSAVTALVAISTVMPALAWARLRVHVSPPADAIAGRPVALGIALSGARAAVKLRVAEPAGEWMAAAAPCAGEAVVVPVRRGVIDHVVVHVDAAGSLGLVRWRRTHRMDLDRPIEVAPAVVGADLPPAVSARFAGDRSPTNGSHGADSVRSIREYTVGDPTRLVHWAATARRGELMVKELEDPDSVHMAVIVDLRGELDAAEDAAARAAGVVAAALRSGLPVTLLTAEPSGQKVGRVVSSLEAGRRLARAISAPPPEGPLPSGATVVRVAP